jgi:osmotically inducible protein OsmC
LDKGASALVTSSQYLIPDMLISFGYDISLRLEVDVGLLVSRTARLSRLTSRQTRQRIFRGFEPKILYVRGSQAIRFKAMKRKGSAVWKGGLKDGSGVVSTESGVLSSVAYSFAKRFGDEAGTNPEELIGAAHAGCFSMAFSAQLGEAGFKAEKIETTATVTLENVGGGFSITLVHLDVQATVPNLDDRKFQEIAKKAKEGCPVSKLFTAEITMDAKLV